MNLLYKNSKKFNTCIWKKKELLFDKKKKFAKNSIRFLIKYILDEGNFGGLKHTQNILRMASSN